MFQSSPDWREILIYFRGSELQNYFTKILEDDLRAIIKPQYVDQILKTVKVTEMGLTKLVVVVVVVIAQLCLQGRVGDILTRKDVCLHLLFVRSPWRLWRGNHALQRPRS